MTLVPSILATAQVFPVNADKSPAVKWKDYSGTVKHAQAYGVHLQKSKLVVIDTDRHGVVDGEQEFLDIIQANGLTLPETFTVKTPTGGYHRFYHASPIIEVRNSASRIAPSVDVRGNGGYVVGPNSRTAAGEYVIIEDAPIAPLNGDLITLLTQNRDTKPAKIQKIYETVAPHDFSRINELDPYQEAAFHSALKRVSESFEGNRNQTLNREVYGLVSIGIHPEDVRDNLLPLTTLSLDESLKTFESAVRAGIAKPRSYEIIPSKAKYVFAIDTNEVRVMITSYLMKEAEKAGKKYYDKKQRQFREQCVLFLQLIASDRISQYKSSFCFDYEVIQELMKVGKRRLQEIFSALRGAGVVETIVEPRSPHDGVPGIKPVYKLSYDLIIRVPYGDIVL